MASRLTRQVAESGPNRPARGSPVRDSAWARAVAMAGSKLFQRDHGAPLYVDGAGGVDGAGRRWGRTLARTCRRAGAKSAGKISRTSRRGLG